MKTLAWLTSFLAWLQIVASPLIVGLIISLLVYGTHPTKKGFLISAGTLVTSLIVGVIMATRTWKKRGTVNFMSRVSATPELDNTIENKDTKVKL